MQFHSTENAENVQLSATSRFPPRMARVAHAAGIVAIVGMGLSSALAASNEQALQESDGHRVCTLATLKGRYLFAASGVLLPPALGVTVPTQAADAGLRMLNGDGTGTDTVTVRIGDKVVLENVVSPLSYTMRTVRAQSRWSMGHRSISFIAPDGSEFAEIG